jgi:hypothetical protein
VRGRCAGAARALDILKKQAFDGLGLLGARSVDELRAHGTEFLV